MGGDGIKNFYMKQKKHERFEVVCYLKLFNEDIEKYNRRAGIVSFLENYDFKKVQNNKLEEIYRIIKEENNEYKKGTKEEQ